MPPLSPPAKVLVTGANGYVGCWVVHALLDKGYSVRAAVRTQQKADTLSALIGAKHPSATSAFKCVVAADITHEDAVDGLLEGVQGVVHTATPVTFSLEDPEDYIRPAVVGTLNIVRGAAKHGSDVKRVVITSSVGAIAESFTADTRVYTEKDWNEYAVNTVRKLGKEASGYMKYGASKVLAEEAAWDYYRENKDVLPYELSVIAPSWILGPIPDDPPSPAAFATPSPILEWEQLFMVPPPEKSHPPVFNYVDIRDVTEMHMRALERPEAAGQRFISNSLVCTWQDWFNAAHDLYVLPGLEKVHPPAALDAESIPPHPIFSNEKAQRLLGIEFKTIPETLKDLVEDFRGRGWLKHLES
ncbi:NAD-P-binding protein [Pilatotrama ljubarskyi]|nr:NAD-P-binding protein [Pilatotrama ljubarskyi]